MASQKTTLDPGVGGDEYQAYLPDDDATAGLRQVVRLAGALQAQFAAVLAALPGASDNGLVVRVAGNRATTGTSSSVPGSATVVTLLAANDTSRIGCSVFNDSTSALYIKTGAGASTTSFSVKVLAGGYWECPFGYSGELTGIWDSATGNARVTEYT